MTRTRGLGKGLGALIPGDEQAIARTAYRELPLDTIRVNRFQPRASFDEATLAELAQSIGEVGVLQPVLVRPDHDGTFELIAGERRWRAARQAGLDVIPAIVREVEDHSALAQAVVENVHRDDLNPLEEAAAYRQLIDDFGLTQDVVSQRVGRSRSAVANTIRLLQLPPAVQRLVAERRLSAGHARALLALEDPDEQVALATEAAAAGVTVRDLEQRVKGPGRPPDRADGTDGIGATKPAALLELEALLERHLDTRVSVSMSERRGRVVVDFATVEDLERIYHAMVGGSLNS